MQHRPIRYVLEMKCLVVPKFDSAPNLVLAVPVPRIVRAHQTDIRCQVADVRSALHGRCYSDHPYSSICPPYDSNALCAEDTMCFQRVCVAELAPLLAQKCCVGLSGERNYSCGDARHTH